MTTYSVNGKAYSIGDLEDLSRQQLAEIYNLIAEANGEKTLGLAKDKTTALARTWAFIKKFGKAHEQTKAAPKAAPQSKEGSPTFEHPKSRSKLEGYTPKAARSRVVKRLTRRLASPIRKVKAPEGNQRLKFWSKYPDRFTLAEIIQSDGLDDSQVRYWLKLGCMKMELLSDAAFSEAAQAFEASKVDS